VPGSDGVWRPGATSHEESGGDLEGYLRPLEQAHATALHGFGVAAGLTLSATAGAGTVHIGPGVAVDRSGRHIVLAPGGAAEVSSTPDVDSVLAAVTVDGVDLSTAGRTGSCPVTVTWRETFDQKLFDDSFQQRFAMRQTPWLRIAAPGSALDEQAVVLGTVDLTAGVVAATGVGADGRVGPVPAVDGLRLRRAAALPAGVTAVDAGELRVRPEGGMRLSASGAPLEIRADHLAVTSADGTERVGVDATLGRLGLGTPAPTHALHVTAISGIRQNALYLGGGPGWSSLSYNAHHDDANSGWVFPDPTRSAVTLEMDDTGGKGRFDIWSTTAAARTSWQLRFGVNGESGAVTIPGSLAVSGGLSAAREDAHNPAAVVTNNSGAALCATSGNGVALTVVGNRQALSVVGPSSFNGAVDVHGQFTATAKHFLIDHPHDPGNRTLAHASVESDERTTFYSGNVVLGDDGGATIALPDWMESLNTDFRYQLTCVGAAAPVYVVREVADGYFAVAGGAAGMTVSWLLVGVRQDAWAQANPLVVEEDKPEDLRGSFRHPEVHGHDRTRQGNYVRHAAALRRNPRLAHALLDPTFGAGPA
jgi:hypothetical protein